MKSIIASNSGKHSLTYHQSGVNIQKGNDLVKRIAKMAPGIGGFSGTLPWGDSYLVASTDGVGTKLNIAFEMDKHDTIGIDLVAMSVNDIVTTGAKPMFFLDYFATGHLDVQTAEKVVGGIVQGCHEAGCILLGGETAEMPGFYSPGHYDIAGFAVGAVDKGRVVCGDSIKKGDVLLGLPSSGLHSNGFSLVRKVLEVSETSLGDKTPWSAKTFGQELLTPTRIYVNDVLRLHEHIGIKGAAHITGGGMTENIPRIPGLDNKNKGVIINTNSWTTHDIFTWLQKKGDISDDEMRRVFNMGIGMVVIVDQHDVDDAIMLNKDIKVIGEVINLEGVRYL
jgi:phosphoribosylformylglycinamidine cyclo-ligase